MQGPEFMTTDEAAAYLGLTPGTLEVWRVRDGAGPRYVRIGDTEHARVRYRKEDLDEWIAAHVTEPQRRAAR